MTRTKLVIRLFDPEQRMLGWVTHDAAVRGDGTLRSSASVVVPIDLSGTLAAVSVHWCDVNVETRTPCPAKTVRSGQLLTVFPADVPLLVVGPQAGGLPPVTVRQAVTIGVPAGALGARGR